MLIQFTVGNFLSFNQKRTLSLEAGSISELKSNIITFNKDKILRSAVIYGANSSGKSNLIKALQCMKKLVLSSVLLNDSDELDYYPFLLSTETDKQPTFFEIIFWQESVKYRYGFEYNQNEIVNEWLFTGKTAKTEKPLFIRNKDGIGITDNFSEGKDNESKTNKNRLFISLVAQLGGNISKQVLAYFQHYNTLSGLEHDDYAGFTKRMLVSRSAGFNASIDLFQKLKLGFKEINTIELDFTPSSIPDNITSKFKPQIIENLKGKKITQLKTIHNKFDNQKNIVGSVVFDKVNNESEGTKKIIDLSGPIFDTLEFGKVLIIDELDAKLHPLITIQIIKIFNSPETNIHNAQLIFATHDTNLLAEQLFRRDQIWFTEKDEFEQTDLYSLYDFNLPEDIEDKKNKGIKVRKDSNYEKNYIRGRYGAIPFITN